MLSDYPILFNETEIPFPNKWQEKWSVVEEVNESEAGTDLINIRRDGKLTVSVTHNVLSEWVKVFRTFRKMDTFTLSIYDMIEEGYAEHTVRMRDYSDTLIPKSQDLACSQGLWTVSYNLIEV